MAQPTIHNLSESSEAPASQEESARTPLFSAYQRNRLLLSIGSMVAFVLCWWAGGVFLVPAFKGFEASLLAQPAWLTCVLLVAVAFAVCAALGTLIAGGVRPDAGIFVACVGWIAFTARGGPIRSVLHGASGPGVYLALAVEMVALALIATGVAVAVQYLRRSRELEEAVEAELEHHEVSPVYKIVAVAFQTIVMAAVVFVLAQSDAKLQALLAVGIGAFTATALAGEAFESKRMDYWYFAGPTLVAVIGYALAFFDPEGLRVGQTYLPLARALPLDYASAGFAGAIAGSWVGDRHPLATVEVLTATLTGGTVAPPKSHKPAIKG